MRPLLLATVIGALALPLAAQTSVQITGGVTGSTALVTDGVLNTTLTPTPAPTVGVAIAIPTGTGPYRVLLEARYSGATLRVTDNNAGVTDNIGSLATITALALVEGPISGRLRWQVGGGAIFYQPSQDQGVFLDGSLRRWLIAGGVVWTHALSPHLRLLINGRVDAHTFTTDVLVARNYSGSQGVQRFALTAGLERTF